MDTFLISVSDFLKRYSISRTSFYDQVKKGDLRIIKRGRRTFVSQPDADAWLETLRQKTEGGAS